MTLFVTVLHVVVCIFLIIVVLLQRGKGAEVGAMFGGGGSGTMFGARGAGNLFTKLTTISAVVFMATSLMLASEGRSNRASDLFEEPEGGASGFEETAPPDTPFEVVDDPGSGFEEVLPDAAVPQRDEPAASEPAPADPETAPVE